MNRLNSIALLAGGALVAIAATGCSSNSPKPAASGPVANSPTVSGPPSPAAPSSTPSGASSSSGANGGSTTAPAANGSSTAAPGGSSTAPNAAPAGHPVCANSKLNASLAPRIAGQAASIAVIAVANTGPTCLIEPIPYLWIVKSPTDASDQLRPLVPGGQPGTAKQQIILSGTTLYAAIDLNPGSAPDAPAGYGYLEVTANPTKETTGKDVQDVQLFEPSKAASAKLGVYTTNPNSAINSIQYATTPEQ